MLHKFGDLDSKYYTTFTQKSFNVVEHDDKCVLRNVVHFQLYNYTVVCQFLM